jgi:hypothetical protein
MIIPLLKDITRCYGEGCELNESCQRFLTMELDREGTFSYCRDLSDNSDICDFYMQDIVE